MAGPMRLWVRGPNLIPRNHRVASQNHLMSEDEILAQMTPAERRQYASGRGLPRRYRHRRR